MISVLYLLQTIIFHTRPILLLKLGLLINLIIFYVLYQVYDLFAL